MDIKKNILQNLKKLVNNNKDLMNCFLEGNDLANFLETNINLGKYEKFKTDQQWEVSDIESFANFQDYQNYILSKNIGFQEEFENIENYLFKLNEIINYIEFYVNDISQLKMTQTKFIAIKNVEYEVSKYKSQKDVSLHDYGTYKKLIRYRDSLGDEWYNQITAHFDESRFIWTLELVEKEIKKYNSLQEIYYKRSGLHKKLYEYKKELGDSWFDQITSHLNS